MRCMFWLFFIFCRVITSLASANNGGFSTIMYHRDGPESPFYDPNLTKVERFIKAIDRDFARINRSLNVVQNTIEAPLKEVRGSYLMKISLGTPIYQFFAEADTGSEQTWIQCRPCDFCYPMHQEIFNPTHSSTYNIIHCVSGQIPCPPFQGMNCVNNKCKSLASYGDGSISRGVLSTDVLTIKSIAPHPPVKVQKYIFGCGHYNKGSFLPDQAGVIGLGRGPRSLITQLDTIINGKFSYCLYLNIHGKVNFGHNAIVEGHGTVTTPLFEKPGDDFAFYFASLEGMTIGNERVDNSIDTNIIIDSGATLTYFTRDFYVKVVNSVRRQIKGRPKRDPKGLLKTCFEDVDGLFQSVPIIAHFAEGANFQLHDYNMFQEVAPDVYCLKVMEGPQSIWGNSAQMDFLIGFDVKARTIKFKPFDCEQAR